MSRSQKFINTASMVVIFVSLAILGLLIFWMVYPARPVAEVKSPAKIITETVSPGERLVYELDRCVYQQTPVDISRQLVDGIVITLEPLIDEPEVGCDINKIASTEIPDNMPPGIYKLKVTTSHHVNPVRTDVVRWETEEFEILPQ